MKNKIGVSVASGKARFWWKQSDFGGLNMQKIKAIMTALFARRLPSYIPSHKSKTCKLQKLRLPI